MDLSVMPTTQSDKILGYVVASSASGGDVVGFGSTAVAGYAWSVAVGLEKFFVLDSGLFEVHVGLGLLDL